MPTKDEKWLQQRHRCWYVVQEIPRSLRSAFPGPNGRPMRRLVKSLHTDNHTLALARRHGVLADFARQFESASLRRTGDPVVRAGLEWRGTIQELERGNLPNFTTRPPDPGQTPQENALSVAYAVIDEEADRIARGEASVRIDLGNRSVDTPEWPADPAVAETFLAIAKGLHTPLEPMLETWLSEEDIEARSKGDHRRAIKELFAWLPAERLPPTIEALDRRAAGQYVSNLLARNLDRAKTVSKRLWSLSSFWRWLNAKGYTDKNPGAATTLDETADQLGISDRSAHSLQTKCTHC